MTDFPVMFRSRSGFQIFAGCIVRIGISQWIALLNRRVEKIEQIMPDHCDIYQKNHNKNAIE